MRFKVTLQKEPKHSELVSCVGWASAEEAFSCGDDHKILRWSQANKETELVLQLPQEVFVTDMHFFPRGSSGGGSKKQTGSDVFALGASDGKFYIIGRSGRVEKNVEAHRGALLSCRWSFDGSALLTAGEDGGVKIWSRNGMLRSTLSQGSVPVYCATWSPDSESVLYTSGKNLIIKSLQANAKPTQWKAHEGVILKLDWNMVNNLIITAGEDCKYKVWDSYGRQLYQGQQHDFPITALAWAPDGEVFAVGSFNTLRLCDKTGWSYALEKPNTGSLFSLCWSSDGTQVAGAGGNGQVIFGYVVDRRLEWGNYEAVVVSEKMVSVRNVMNDAREKLDFRDNIVKISFKFGHLVVTTTGQCYIYSHKNWNTPSIFELREGSVSLIVQANRQFLLVDGGGINIYSYDGRLVSTPKSPGLQANTLNASTVALSNDTLAIRDRVNEKQVFLFDALSGKLMGDGKPMEHKQEVIEVSLDQLGPEKERRLVIIDKNREMYITPVRVFGTERRVYKLGTMVQSLCWDDESNMLAGIADMKLTVWYYPSVVFVDQELLTKSLFQKNASEFGRNPQIIGFHGSHVRMRRADGSVIHAAVPPYPGLLHRLAIGGKWNDAVRLCRYVREDSLWSCLAAMAAYEKDLQTAEIAYASINEADKVSYLQHIRDMPSKEARNAEMALFCGSAQDAEAILLQSNNVFRSIMLNLAMYNWTRALDLAVKHKTHVDTVLAYRQEFLDNFDKTETDPRFQQYAKGVDIDWRKINAKVDMEYQRERGGGESSGPSHIPSGRRSR